MKTFENFEHGIDTLPAGIGWYLADIAESKGKQELYTHQSPQKLKILKEHALIESTISSNRIEGVEIDRKRIGTVVFGKPLLKDRNEEEVHGYRKALEWIHTHYSDISITKSTFLKLHKYCRGEIWDAGKIKEKDGDIIERLPTGDTRVRFKTVSAKDTPLYTTQLNALYKKSIKGKWIHEVIAIAAYNLDFLCIHPFRDGNGRVSRLLLLLQLYHAGYQVGKYISLERLIEEYKERYYETLEISSNGWHTGNHDPWSYINFILYLLKIAYKEFTERLEAIPEERGSKKAFVINVVHNFIGEFTIAEVYKKCPAVSKDMVRKVMKDLQKKGSIVSNGRGPGAKWVKKGNTL